METRYYSDKSQSGGVHKLALHASKEVFQRIKGHHERKERIMAELAKETQYKQYLRDGNKAMTDKWENSVEYLRKKKKEAREQKLAQKVDDRVEQYHKVLKQQAEERAKYNEEVMYKRFFTTGAQKELNSAVLKSDCIFENVKLIELKQMNENTIDADWKAYENKIIEEDEIFKKDELIKQCIRKKNAEEYNMCLMKQIEEQRAQREEEKRTKLENDKIDIERQMEELKIIQKNEHEDLMNAKEYWRKTLQNSRDIKIKQQQAYARQDAEIDVVAQVFRDTKSKIECKRRKMRQEEMEKTQEKQRAACKVLMDIYSQKQNKENQIIAKAIAEQEEEEESKLQKKLEHQRQQVEDRRKNYEDAMAERNKKREEELEVTKWKMLNRMKFVEIVGNEGKDMEEKLWNKKIRYRKELDEQMEDERKRREEKKIEEESFKWHNYPEMDQKFMNYANEMLSKQKEAGRPLYPLEHLIMEYKKRNGLIPPNMQKHLQCSVGQTSEEKKKLHSKTRRICPVKNDSSGMKDCFCPNK
ncbi:hypothetical protein WA026_001577 [Henosepilachna vigintioctopunctata]|uniref:Trichohyalin-plectin-homology domain-containing protein n=1 Tax=Henosepilachna vigintioctopunctata TaxID=420089 RepID=A0AAW1URE1_9CUCU